MYVVLPLPAFVAAFALPDSHGTTTLRTMRAADADAFASYRRDPELARFQGWLPIDLDQARAFVTGMSHVTQCVPGDWVQLAIADATSDAMVGDLGLCLDADASSVEIGFTVARPHQRQGHAARAVALALRQAFRWPSVAEARGVTDARNAASIAVLESAGFTRTDERRVEFKGEWCTEYLYVRTRDTSSHGAPTSPKGK